MKSIRRTFFYAFLIATLTACNLPGGEPETDFNTLATYAAQTLIAAGTQPAQTPSPTAAPQQDELTPSTQSADSTPSDPDCNRAQFVSDVTVADDTTFFVQKEFTKTWRLKNIGTCTWTSAYTLVFDSGERMSGALTQPLSTGSVAPGESVDVSVDLIAPALAGTYRSNWQIRSDKGETFALASGPFWVQIKVRRGGVVVWRTLKQGDSGAEVYALQYLLRQQGLTPLADGVFGADTLANLKKFHNRKDIQEDTAGPDTWETIIVEVKRGGNGEAVRALQVLLRSKFGYTLEVDGIFGPLTEEALKDFQTKQGLTPDGIADPLTWQKLIGK